MLVAAGPAAAIHHLLLGVLSPSPAAYNVVAGNQAALDREKSSPHRRPHPTRAPATDYISLFTGWPDQSPARRHQHEERRGDGLRVTIYDIAWALPAEDHHDWRPEPHSRRRTRLDELFTGVAPPLQLSPSTTGQDKALQWLDPSSARVGIEGVLGTGYAVNVDHNQHQRVNRVLSKRPLLPTSGWLFGGGSFARHGVAVSFGTAVERIQW